MANASSDQLVCTCVSPKYALRSGFGAANDDTAKASINAADSVAALKVGEDSVQGTIDELIAAGLVATDASEVRITDAGRAVYERITKETSPVSARIWGGIPEEDLLATGRVLALVTERANAELAAVAR